MTGGESHSIPAAPKQPGCLARAVGSASIHARADDDSVTSRPCRFPRLPESGAV